MPTNIVVIQADQLAARALGPYGNRVVKAPNIDSLAARGIVFENAYCNSPLCAPSRASMLTGRLPSEIGAYDNATELPAATPTFAHHMRAAGYRTVLCGKMHFVGPDQHHGFEERLTTDIYPADFGWTPDWDGDDFTGDYLGAAMDGVRGAGVAESTIQLEFDEMVAERAVGAVHQWADAADGRPLFLVASFTHPHDPFLVQREYWDRYAEQDIDMPTVGLRPRRDLDHHTRHVSDLLGIYDTPLSEDEIRTARRAYYGAVSYVDDKVGQLLDALDQTGTADETVVIFTADHGEMLGERGLWFKMTMFEDSVRIPLIAAGPAIAAGRRAEPVSLLDVFPTLAGLSGSRSGLATHLEGADILGSLDPEREIHSEYLGEGATEPVVMVRRGRHKYVTSASGEAMLFDVEADRHELEDLAGRQSHTEPLEELASAASRRRDLVRLRRDIVASQTVRRELFASLTTGSYRPWDHEVDPGDADRFVRNVPGASAASTSDVPDEGLAEE